MTSKSGYGCGKLLPKARTTIPGCPCRTSCDWAAWRDVKSVQPYMGLLNDAKLETAVEATWA
jgi:hypothetical protein